MYIIMQYFSNEQQQVHLLSLSLLH
jgi:hypothetical protein